MLLVRIKLKSFRRKSNGDQKKLFNIVNTLLGRRKPLGLPDYNNPITLVSTFNMFLLIRLLTFVQSFHCLREKYRNFAIKKCYVKGNKI